VPEGGVIQPEGECQQFQDEKQAQQRSAPDHCVRGIYTGDLSQGEKDTRHSTQTACVCCSAERLASAPAPNHERRTR
jgi:hypothetical protein